MSSDSKLVLPKEIKQLFVQCDKLCEKCLAIPFQSLVAQIQMQLVMQMTHDRELTLDENNSQEWSADEESEDDFLLMRERVDPVTQQIMIEQLVLPFMEMKEDVEPCSSFTMEFIQLLQEQFASAVAPKSSSLSFAQSGSELFEFLNRIVIPICQMQSMDRHANGDDDDSYKQGKNGEWESGGSSIQATSNLYSLQVFFNCYFASLVTKLQKFILRALEKVFPLLNTSVRLWAIRAFYLPVLNDSFDTEKRKIAKKTMIKYKQDWSKDYEWVALLEPVEFLTRSEMPQIEEQIPSRAEDASIGVMLCINSVRSCSRCITSLIKKMRNVSEEGNISRIISNVYGTLVVTHELFNDGDVKSFAKKLRIMREQASKATTDTKGKKKKKSKKSRKSIFSLDSLMKQEESEQLLELISDMFASIRILTEHTATQSDVRTMKRLYQMMRHLANMSALILPQIQSSSPALYESFVRKDILSYMSTIAISIKSNISNLQIVLYDTDEEYESQESLIRTQVKLLDSFYQILLKTNGSLDTLNNISTSNSSNSILATVISHFIERSDVHYPLMATISDRTFDELVINGIIKYTLVDAAHMLASEIDKRKNLLLERNDKSLRSVLTYTTRKYIMQTVSLCHLISRYRGSQFKVNRILEQLLSSSQQLDRYAWMVKHKATPSTVTSSALRSKQSSLHMLLRVSLACLLQSNGFIQMINIRNRTSLASL